MMATRAEEAHMMRLRETPIKPALITPRGGVRCWSCGSRFANQISSPYDIDCRHCKAKNADSTPSAVREAAD